MISSSKIVTLPVFSGAKRTYQNWKATFAAKLLQLRECLAEVTLKTVEDLGHLAIAYETAKEEKILVG